MEDKKLCPFKIMQKGIQQGTDYRSSNRIETYFGYCEQKKCAMWVTEILKNTKQIDEDWDLTGYCGLSNKKTR